MEPLLANPKTCIITPVHPNNESQAHIYRLRVYIHKYPCTSSCVNHYVKNHYVKERKTVAIIRRKGDPRRWGKMENQTIAAMAVSISIWV